jgi:hypothetical protein
MMCLPSQIIGDVGSYGEEVDLSLQLKGSRLGYIDNSWLISHSLVEYALIYDIMKKGNCFL